MSQASLESRSLSSGLVIAGAYADKVRRTLFAQLKDLMRQDKEFAREIARAAGELNAVLYRILVEEVKIEKGDVVRIRVNYRIDPGSKRIIWDYNTLSIEAFKRIPDEKVLEIVNDVVRNKLSKILEEFSRAPRAVEEKVKAFEIPEERGEASPPPPQRVSIRDIVASVDVLGETIDGGLLLKLSDSQERSVGLASVSPSGEELVIDAIIIHAGSSMRYITRTRVKLSEYSENPSRLISDLEKIQPTTIPPQEAEKLIRDKMQNLL